MINGDQNCRSSAGNGFKISFSKESPSPVEVADQLRCAWREDLPHPGFAAHRPGVDEQDLSGTAVRPSYYPNGHADLGQWK
jgi:hypothetical protein